METMTTPKAGGASARTKRTYAPLFEKLCDEAIPVGRLVFTVARTAGPDLPIPNGSGGVMRLEAKPGIKIDLIPKLHCFRIVITSNDVRLAPDGEIVHMVPREWASWEPLAIPR